MGTPHQKKPNPVAIVFLLLSLVLIFYIYRSGGCTQSTKSRVSNSTQWFQGGTLHDASIRQWENASYRNKLATAGDWLAATKWKGHLNSPDDFDRVKLKSQMLVEGIDIAITEMEGAYADDKVVFVYKMFIDLTGDLDP